MRKILKALVVIQERKIKGAFATHIKMRLNPFHPLSYITILLSIVIGFVMFGVVGFWKETDLRNPFIWR